MLPYNEGLLEYLQLERAAGRRIGLFTAADQSIADAVWAHLGFFDVVCGSDGITNLSDIAKAAAIEAEFGPVFAYAGNSNVDLPIFARAANSIFAGPAVRLLVKRQASPNVAAKFPLLGPGLAVWAQALRLKHWAKNALVFVAPFLSGEIGPLLLGLILFTVMGGS